MPLNGLARITTLAQGATGQGYSNSIHVVNESDGAPPTLAQLQGLVDDFNNVIATAYRQVLTTTDTLLSFTATQVRDPKVEPPEVLLQAQHTVNLAGQRVVSGTASPQELCVLLSIRSSVASRRFRGHLFLPPALSQASYSGDFFVKGSDPYWLAAQGLATVLTSGLDSSSSRWAGSTLGQYSLCNYSYVAELANEDSVALASSVLLRQAVHWLRSRNRGTT